jgi:hypothetical protein
MVFISLRSNLTSTMLKDVSWHPSLTQFNSTLTKTQVFSTFDTYHLNSTPPQFEQNFGALPLWKIAALSLPKGFQLVEPFGPEH